LDETIVSFYPKYSYSTLANSWKHQQLSGRQHWAKR